MFYRRKSYLVKAAFVETFNRHFNETNLPNQLEHGSRLVGRWMKANEDDTVEVFAIWEYDSYEHYREIESQIRSNPEHIQRVQDWYEKHGGKAYVFKEWILKVKNEEIESTVKWPPAEEKERVGE